MTAKEIMKLRPGDIIYHYHFGDCKVIERQLSTDGQLFGIVIIPVTAEGLVKLSYLSNMSVRVPLLETTYRLIKSKS